MVKVFTFGTHVKNQNGYDILIEKIQRSESSLTERSWYDGQAVKHGYVCSK